MGSHLGAEKSAAAKIGVTVDVYRQNRAAGLRWCFRCRGWKQLNAFSIDRSRATGRTASCKECASDASTASRYKLSLTELIAFRTAHEHRCGICGKADGPLYVDHNHQTGRPRGLLCPGCNTAIGLLRENPELFAAALAYLENGNG